jgi:hypothetical protein
VAGRRSKPTSNYILRKDATASAHGRSDVDDHDGINGDGVNKTGSAGFLQVSAAFLPAREVPDGTLFLMGHVHDFSHLCIFRRYWSADDLTPGEVILRVHAVLCS